MVDDRVTFAPHQISSTLAQDASSELEAGFQPSRWSRIDSIGLSVYRGLLHNPHTQGCTPARNQIYGSPSGHRLYHHAHSACQYVSSFDAHARFSLSATLLDPLKCMQFRPRGLRDFSFISLITDRIEGRTCLCCIASDCRFPRLVHFDPLLKQGCCARFPNAP